MNSLSSILSIIGIICIVGCNCENTSYSKSCFIKYLMEVKQIDERYKNYIRLNEASNDECGKAVNLTLDAIRTSSKEPCIANFLRKKDITDVLLRKFLMPQLDNADNRVHFDDKFTSFRKNAVDILSVVCNNPKIFKPDVVELMQEAKSKKKSNSKELRCLEIYIKKMPNVVLTNECKNVVDYVRKDFYKKMENEMMSAFAAPNDQLMDLECSKEKAKQFNLFERVFFFVVLSTSRDMNDKQINAVAKNADNAILNSQKVIFECMKM